MTFYKEITMAGRSIHVQESVTKNCKVPSEVCLRYHEKVAPLKKYPGCEFANSNCWRGRLWRNLYDKSSNKDTKSRLRHSVEKKLKTTKCSKLLKEMRNLVSEPFVFVTPCDNSNRTTTSDVKMKNTSTIPKRSQPPTQQVLTDEIRAYHSDPVQKVGKLAVDITRKNWTEALNSLYENCITSFPKITIGGSIYDNVRAGEYESESESESKYEDFDSNEINYKREQKYCEDYTEGKAAESKFAEYQPVYENIYEHQVNNVNVTVTDKSIMGTVFRCLNSFTKQWQFETTAGTGKLENHHVVDKVNFFYDNNANKIEVTRRAVSEGEEKADTRIEIRF
mmetsp:Transcript_22644/g.28895  ORF Transcript_22644/g.28895 Transcript_22644/m.28895 type:complete len:337 (-) Transcript_22644:459-1469(-)